MSADLAQVKACLLGILRENGADLCGVGDLSAFSPLPMRTGVAVAGALDADMLCRLAEGPTEDYPRSYEAVNRRLEAAVIAGEAYLQSLGYAARANVAAITRRDENWRTPIPHKTYATMAGLGWVGKSCILVTPEYGSGIRLCSLLTDAPLPPDTPVLESRCGGCARCVEACPGNAFSGTTWVPGIEREALFTKELCVAPHPERRMVISGQEKNVCGLCSAVCPYTRRYVRRALQGAGISSALTDS